MKKTKVVTNFQVEYDLITSKTAKRTYILLHGFYENASIIREKILHLLPEDSNILIPNACFPVAKRRPEGWKLYFSWYFYNEKTNEFYIEYDFPAGVLEKLIDQLKLNSLPITIIGYSQGGYLSPFLAERLSSCDQVIGLGCSYKYDLLKEVDHYKIDAIHGKIDDKVDPINAENCFNKLSTKHKGTFHMLENTGHELDQSFIKKLQELLP